MNRVSEQEVLNTIKRVALTDHWQHFTDDQARDVIPHIKQLVGMGLPRSRATISLAIKKKILADALRDAERRLK